MNQIDKHNITEIKKLIKKAKTIESYVMTSQHDGVYLRVYKNDILEQLDSMVLVQKWDLRYFVMNESTLTLYIN
jgi:hypothetical protein